MAYIDNSLLFTLAQEIVSMADKDFRDIENLVSSWGNKSFLGIDNGKIYWQYTGEVRFAFGFLEPNFLIYWGAYDVTSLIPSNAHNKIDLYNDLTELDEEQFAYRIQNSILQVCQRRYPNYEMRAYCRIENIVRDDKPCYDDIVGCLVPTFEEHFCCNIYVKVKQIRSESSSSY